MSDQPAALSPPKPKLEKATTVDVVVSCLLPFWGVVVGLIALAKGERKRALTMIGIGGVLLVLAVASQVLQTPR